MWSLSNRPSSLSLTVDSEAGRLAVVTHLRSAARCPGVRSYHGFWGDLLYLLQRALLPCLTSAVPVEAGEKQGWVLFAAAGEQEGSSSSVCQREARGKTGNKSKEQAEQWTPYPPTTPHHTYTHSVCLCLTLSIYLGCWAALQHKIDRKYSISPWKHLQTSVKDTFFSFFLRLMWITSNGNLFK